MVKRKGGETEIYEGGRYVLSARRKKRSKFWERFNGSVCTVVTMTERAGACIVEVDGGKELICCYLRDLSPIQRC
jgi:hypothetical protein